MKTKRFVVRLLKYFGLTIIFLHLLVFIIIGIAKLFEGSIIRLAVKEIESSLKAPISYGEVSLVPFREFPNLTVRISDFKLGQQADSVRVIGIGSLPDTLVGFKNVFVSVKAYPLLKDKVIINGVELNGFRVNYLVDSTGKSNFDFLIPPDTVETPVDTVTQTILNILLKNLTLSDIHLTYSDQKLKAAADIVIPELHLEGRVSGDSIWGKSKGEIVVTNTRFADLPLEKVTNLNFSYSVDYDNGNLLLDFAKLDVNGIELKATGNATLSDSIWMDFSLALPKLNLAELYGFVPEGMIKEYGLSKLGGTLKFNTIVRGYLYDTLMLPSVFVDFDLRKGVVETKQYPKVNKLDFEGSVSIPNPNYLATSAVNIKKFNLETQQSRANLTLRLKNPSKPLYNIQGDMHLVLDEFAPLLPDSILTELSGLIDAKFFTRGKMPEYLDVNSSDYFMDNTGFSLTFSNINAGVDTVNVVKELNAEVTYSPGKELTVNNLSLRLPAYKVGLKDGLLKVKVIGRISELDKIDVRVDTLHIAMGNSSFSSKMKFKNLKSPVFKAEGRLYVDLDEVQQFIPDTLVSLVTGKIDFGFSTSGTINPDSIDKQIMPILFENSMFAAQINDFGFSLPNDSLIGIDRLSLTLSMANDTIRISNLLGNYKDLEFKSDSTSIWNVYKAFLKEEKDKKLIVNTSLWANKIDYDMFLPFMEEDSTNLSQNDSIPTISDSIPSDTSSSYMPQYIVRGIAKVDRIKYGKVILDNLSTKFRIDDSLYVLDELRMNAFGGSLVTSLVYDTRKYPLEIIEFKNESNRVNIKQLLEQNDDFEQDYITHKNIDGIVTGTVFGRIVMQDTNLLYDKMNLLGNFKLENGGIYNFEPAMELSKFTNLNELNNIVFNTLETSVFIYNNQIYFPKTNIVSTAMDMSVYGMQSFADDYEYHFVVYPGDVMLGKSKKLLKKQGLKDEGFEGPNKAKRSGLYLVAFERGKESKYGFDTKELQAIMKATIRVQERGLNLVFHPHVMNFSTELDRKEPKRKPADENKDGKEVKTN
ncbi:AsmA family protein [Tenuifilum osseticum]|uniref:AsmA family protein n=1 Tax=Tenuifilum osseticum TaxID=3374723 RepID=UPI0034E6193A